MLIPDIDRAIVSINEKKKNRKLFCTKGSEAIGHYVDFFVGRRNIPGQRLDYTARTL